MELLAPPTSGAGEAPHFEWRAVDGAASYRLFILDGAGAPLWAWQGPETSVWMGGTSRQRREGEAGPSIVAGSTWTIAALDAEDHVLAISEVRPVAP